MKGREETRPCEHAERGSSHQWFRLLKLLSHHQMIAKTSIIEPSPIRVSSATRARTSTSGAVRTARAAPSTLPPTASKLGGHARPPGPLPSPRRPIGPCCCLRPHRRILPSGLQPRWRAGARLHVHALRLLVASRFVVLPFTDLVVVLMTSPLPSLGSDSPDLPLLLAYRGRHRRSKKQHLPRRLLNAYALGERARVGRVARLAPSS